MPLPTPYHTTASRSNHSFNLLIYPYRLVLPVLGQLVNGIIQNILLCLATPSPILIVKFLHLVTFSDNLLFCYIVLLLYTVHCMMHFHSMTLLCFFLLLLVSVFSVTFHLSLQITSTPLARVAEFQNC